MRPQEASRNEKGTRYYVCLYGIYAHSSQIHTEYLYFILAIILGHNSSNDNTISVFTGAYTANSNFPECLHARLSSGTD